MIPNERSYCEVDPEVRDQWGIPVLRFHWQWTDHEYNQVRHMQETFRTLVAEMGGEVFSPMPSREDGYGILPGGHIIHELGGAPLGRWSARDAGMIKPVEIAIGPDGALHLFDGGNDAWWRSP